MRDKAPPHAGHPQRREERAGDDEHLTRLMSTSPTSPSWPASVSLEIMDRLATKEACTARKGSGLVLEPAWRWSTPGGRPLRTCLLGGQHVSM